MAQFEFIEWLLTWLFSQTAFDFIWDDGNATKSWLKHRVTTEEAEQVFLNRDCLVPLGIQVHPEANEPRFGALGISMLGKMLSVSFTIRAGKIRIISARPMSSHERRMYAAIR